MLLSTGPVYIMTYTAGMMKNFIVPRWDKVIISFYTAPTGVPQLLEVTFVRVSEVSLIWRDVPCDQQNGPITGYVVWYYATCGPDRDVQQTKSVVATGSIIDGLTPNAEYVFQVAAVNTNGTGPFGEPVTLGGNHHM